MVILIYCIINCDNIYEKFTKKEHKQILFLNLILYNESDIYNNMRDVLRKYLKLQNVDYYFYCYKPNIENEYQIIDDIIYLSPKIKK